MKRLISCGLSPLSLHLVGKGGSTRNFWRVCLANGRSVIYIGFDPSIRENTLYADIATFLAAQDVNTPEVIFANPAAPYLVLQDLGDEDLFAKRHHANSERLKLYKQTLAEIAKIHRFHLGALLPTLPPLMPAFDEALYRWEREYFWDNFFCPFSGRGVVGKIPDAVEAELALMAGVLLSCQETLIHRDLQAQNVMIHAGSCYLIDFQGMRLGNPLYDVASLLFDPYVELDDTLRGQLFECYLSLMDGRISATLELLFTAAAQRLLQALGAYGVLSLKRGKSQFLAHIPRALENLRKVLAILPQYPQTAALVAAIDEGCLRRVTDWLERGEPLVNG